MAIGESDEEYEISIIHLKDKIKFLSKEPLSELLLDFIDESKDLNNEKEQLSKECVILKEARTNSFHLKISKEAMSPLEMGRKEQDNEEIGLIRNSNGETTVQPEDASEEGTGLCARFQANPKKSHLTVVKRIFRYLKGITGLFLWYPKGSNFNLVGYTDVDYAGFLVDRKSTLGMTHFLGSCLVSWATKRQNSVALSTAEAEYVAAASYYA
ncbi:uncharacterized mitochondrial protein AtMg00810-like [Nicotiana sylvestris]|uniref:uncharacterized mitochondrial protein AtMg00810-like n=1 Tax=Nicotiana sylvestris TaxID=4096 RepID=UPI00388C70C8